MTKSSIFAHRQKVVRCPTCKTIVMDIQSGSKPFKPNSTGMTIGTRCHRCGVEVKIILDNT